MKSNEKTKLAACTKDHLLCLIEGFCKTILLAVVLVLSNLLASSHFGGRYIGSMCIFDDGSIPVLTTAFLVGGLILAVALHYATRGKLNKKLALVADIVPLIFALFMTGWFMHGSDSVHGALINATRNLAYAVPVGGCGYEVVPSWQWMLICVCIAIGFVLRKPSKKQVIFFLIGIVAAGVIGILMSNTVELLALGNYDCSGDTPCKWIPMKVNVFETYQATAYVCAACAIALIVSIVTPIIALFVKKDKQK